MKYAIVALTQMSTGLCLFFALEGQAWINNGYGIHPMVAGAAAAGLFALPYMVRKLYK